MWPSKEAVSELGQGWRLYVETWWTHTGLTGLWFVWDCVPCTCTAECYVGGGLKMSCISAQDKTYWVCVNYAYCCWLLKIWFIFSVFYDYYFALLLLPPVAYRLEGVVHCSRWWCSWLHMGLQSFIIFCCVPQALCVCVFWRGVGGFMWVREKML